jgi:hypothetical protein
VVVAGCSHPGIERIIAAATAGAVKPDVYMLFGGLHLVQDTDEQINGTLDVLEKTNKVQRNRRGTLHGGTCVLSDFSSSGERTMCMRGSVRRLCLDGSC